ncbi:sterol desaturase family protein [Undibacterium sp.]|uniref:sterol desaturase family protein n=1 Tax=Undibacterium sp. TaxID=1914977 RepID=UPI00374CCBA8
MEKFIVLIFPLFSILMCVEFAYGWFKQRNTYRLNDALSSLSQGLISQLVALVTQLFQIGLYALVFDYVALAPHAPLWETWYGWIIAIVMFDFCDYWLHRFGHECAVMWAAHMVHHQSQDFNFSTALRQESTVAFIGWVFYLPMAVAGVPPEQFAIAGLIVLLYQFWIHTEHIGKLGWFDRVFSSPSNHRVHHAVNDQYLDKNYGGMLVIWDRMFGTFAEEKEACVYGTRTALKSWDPVWAICAEYIALWKVARQTERWPDKLRVWFKAPGWRPADFLAKFPDSQNFDLEEARRIYNPPLARNAAYVAVAQFVLAVVASAAYLWFADDFSYGLSLLLTGIVIAGFWGLGAYMQGRISFLQMVMIDFLGAGLAGGVLWLGFR